MRSLILLALALAGCASPAAERTEPTPTVTVSVSEATPGTLEPQRVAVFGLKTRAEAQGPIETYLRDCLPSRDPRFMDARLDIAEEPEQTVYRLAPPGQQPRLTVTVEQLTPNAAAARLAGDWAAPTLQDDLGDAVFGRSPCAL